ncbi:MAG: hypothetical protein HY542_05170 [Deltaproteobacteria bacterium]|nr:hypothetical protein [Deltaproteobacteria bacterium]
MTWMVKYRDPKRIEKAISRMRPSVRRAFAQAVIDLKSEGPRPLGWHVKDLAADYRGMMSLRLDYHHRMVYSVVREILTIEIIEVSTREGAYR